MSQDFPRNDVSFNSEDEAGNHRSQTQIPEDLEDHGKHYLAKAGKRNKSVRFPGPYSPGNSTTDNSSSDSERNHGMLSGENANLPTFNLNAETGHFSEHSIEEDKNNEGDEKEAVGEHLENFYASEGSSEDMKPGNMEDKEADKEAVNEKEEIVDDLYSKCSKTSKQFKSGVKNSRRSNNSLHRSETNGTDH